MEAVPRLSMISSNLKVSPSNTEFGPILKRYIRDHYHEDPESYSKEVKELETLRQNAIKAPMDFTGCSILKKYYAQLQKLQSRFPMTDDGAACVPFMWTDIYSGVAYNITDIEYEEACILYNIGALHSKLGTMDSRVNAEGIKIACTHFQCAAWAFQHLRDTFPQPKGSDMSHDLLTCFINIMLAQAQECILEKSMLDNRKSSITAKIATQVVEYYKCALGVMVASSPSSDAGSFIDIVGSKTYARWERFIQFKMYYYTSIAHLYMGNQAEENQKWGERVAWFTSANEQLTEAFKLAKKLSKDEPSINDALSFTNDVIAGKHSSSKKENDFVYHDKVPPLTSLPELKGASLVKGIPFSASDAEVSGPDIFARLVPMEAHETSSLYSEEKAKILRSVTTKIEGKNEELVAYLSSLQLENPTSFDDEDNIPQELIEKCAALSVRPTAVEDLKKLMAELLDVSKDVEASLQASMLLLAEEEQKETKHQDTFGKRGPSMISVDLKKECSKYEEAHKKAIASNNTLYSAVNVHLENLTKLYSPLEQIAASLPSVSDLKTPENVKAMDDFNHLVNKVEEMRKQRQFLENQLREALLKDDITKRLVTLDKKEDLQNTFAEELKKHNETLVYLDQNLTAQDNILCALTAANANYADTRNAIREIKAKRDEIVNTLVSSYDTYDDLVEKVKKGLEFYKKLQVNVTRLLTRIKSVTKVQDEERGQRAEAELRKGGRIHGAPSLPQETPTPKLRDYLPYMNKRGGVGVPPASMAMYPSLQPSSVPPQAQYASEPMRQATLGGPSSATFDRSLKPSLSDIPRSEDIPGMPSMGVRPTPVGSEQTTSPGNCNSSGAGYVNPSYPQQPWNTENSGFNNTQANYQFPCQVQQLNSTYPSNALPKGPSVPNQQDYNRSAVGSNSYNSLNYSQSSFQQPSVSSTAVPSLPYSYGTVPQSSYQPISNVLPNNQHATFTSSTYAYSVGADTPNSATQPSNSTISSSVPSQIPMNQSGSSGTSFSSYPAASLASPANFYHNNSIALPTNATTMPYSGQQTVPTSTIANLPSQNQPKVNSQPSQMYSTSSTNVMPPASYSALNPSMQYQGPGVSVQAKQASVTASMDTKTSTLNSLNNYAIADSSISTSFSQQDMYAYMTGKSTLLPSAASNVTPSVTHVPTSITGVQNQVGMPYTATQNQPGGVFNSSQNQVNVPTSSVQHQTVISSNVIPGQGSVQGYYPGTVQAQATFNAGVSQQKQVNVPSSTPTGPVQTVVMQNQNDVPSHAAPGQYFIPSNLIQNQTGYYPSAMKGQIGIPYSNAQAQPNTPQSSLHETQAYPTQISMQSQISIPASSVQQLPSNTLQRIPSYSPQTSLQPHAGFSTPGPVQSQSGNAASGIYQAQNSTANPQTMQTQPSSNYSSQINYGSYPNTTSYSSQPLNSSFAGVSQTNYNVLNSSNQAVPNTAYTQNAVTPQNYANISSTTNMQYNNYTISQQQINQTENLSPINAAYGPNASNQKLPTPMQPQPLTPSQTSPINSSNLNNESKNLGTVPDSTTAVDSQVSVKRDFITPPPDQVCESGDTKEVSNTLPVLQPKVIDLKSLAELKEKEPSHLAKDPLDDPSVCTKFASEVEKYEKFVDGLVRKSLNGTTPLDQKWKEFTDVQDKESRKRSISVARCCPLKNRYPDVMPYDCNRVKLVAAKDDYINASYLTDICSNSPVFVITQAPLPATFNDFWLMVWEQQVETLICLLSDLELKNHVYFPKDKGQVLTYGAFELSLHSHKVKNGFVERMINITHIKNRTSHVVVHLQYTEWPVSGVPSSPATVLQFITDALSYYKQQRNLMRPIVVHCSAGIGRSGCFCLIAALVCDMNNGHGPRDVMQVAASVSHQRKLLIQDKDQLMFCYNAVLYYAQDMLMRRGILTTRASFDDKLPSSVNTSSHVRHPSEDFILGGGLAKLQSGIAKLGLSDDSETQPELESKVNSEKSDNLIGNGNIDNVSGDKPKEVTDTETGENENTGKQSRKASLDKTVPSITSILDPSNFTLDATSSPAKRKITKENFATAKGSLTTSSSDSADPLSQLDPLWSLKK